MTRNFRADHPGNYPYFVFFPVIEEQILVLKLTGMTGSRATKAE